MFYIGVRRYRLLEVLLFAVERDSNHTSEWVSATREGCNDWRAEGELGIAIDLEIFSNNWTFSEFFFPISSCLNRFFHTPLHLCIFSFLCNKEKVRNFCLVTSFSHEKAAEVDKPKARLLFGIEMSVKFLNFCFTGKVITYSFCTYVFVGPQGSPWIFPRRPTI